MPDCVNAPVCLFADDTKMYTETKNEEDKENLQKDLDSLQNWSDKWLLKFHPNKCKVVNITQKQLEDEH